MHRFNGPTGRGVVAAVVSSVLWLSAAPRLLAQGSLTTTDGMKFSLTSNGSVTDLQQSGVEYASSGLVSGFLYRELPASVTSIVPNGSFESGTGSVPSSWTLTAGTAGAWSYDTSKKADGTRSMKVSISGTAAKRSPTLNSSVFSITPNTAYTVTYQSSTTGLSYPMSVFLYEQASDGTVKKREMISATGTTGWTTKSLTFTSSPIASKAYFQILVFSGYGTAWVDDLRMTDVFGGRVPAAFGGTVTSDSGGMTQTASVSGLNLNARFTSVGTAVRVDATLTDTTGQDRPIEVSYRLPLDVAGWSWDQDFVTPMAIVDGTRYENNNTSFNAQGRSKYPFATVHNGVASFSLAVPMGPQMQRFAYDTAWGLRSAWDWGLSAAATKTKSKASWTFWIFTGAPQWGMRAAAQKLYALDPASFTTSVKLPGAWVLPSGGQTLSQISGYQDFGLGVQEGDGAQDIALGDQVGILSYHYVDPMNWFWGFPSYTQQPPYDVIVSTLNTLAASGTGTTVDGAPVKEMAQAVVNSSPYDQNQKYEVQLSSYFWYSGDLQSYPVSPDPNIPAPSMWSVFKKYSVDGRISMWADDGYHLDGIFLDDLTFPHSNLENHRRAHWAYSDYPLTFSYKSRKVMLYTGHTAAEFCKSLRSYLNGQGLGLMGSATALDMIWVGAGLDVLSGEVRGAESTGDSYLRRTLSYGKNWTNLFVPAQGTGAPTAADVLAYLRQALALGFYPGFNGAYWSSATSYNRDRALFKQYVPLLKTIISAGWKPIPYATSSDPAIRIERFDDQAGDTFYLTAQNSSTASKSFQATVDAKSLDVTTGTITLKELVGNTTISASRSGNNILFSDSLAAGETALYKMTVTGTTSSGPTSGVPANGSFESGSGFPSSWTLGASVTDGSWSWDASTAQQGSRSVKIAVAGTVSKTSPAVVSANFPLAGGVSRTLSAWTKSSGVGGTYPPLIVLVELDASGNVLYTPQGAVVQHLVYADTGTTGWVQDSETFTTDARCKQAYVYASIYKGYGTFWLDNVQLQ